MQIHPPQPPADTAAVPTIETNHLADLYLPYYKEHVKSLEYMDKASTKAYGKRTFAPLHTARMAVYFATIKLAGDIRDRGGLLLIGGAA